MGDGRLQKTRVAVFYYTRSGNTKKIADAIAEEMGVSAIEASAVGGGYSMKKCDLIFVGSGNYIKSPGKEMITFLETLVPAEERYAVVFGTGGGSGTQHLDKMKKLLEKKGVKVLGEWSCPGQEFSLKNKGRPNEEDQEDARKFSKKMLKRIEVI